MTAVLDEVARHGGVPVLSVPDAELGDDLGAALVAGGLPVAEVTFRTPAAADAIRGWPTGGTSSSARAQS